MAFVINAIEVADYNRWRSVYDGMQDGRKERGVREARVFQEVGDPNRVTVYLEGDLGDLQAYFGSQILKDAMAEAGVLGPPRLSFLNEVT